MLPCSSLSHRNLSEGVVINRGEFRSPDNSLWEMRSQHHLNRSYQRSGPLFWLSDWIAVPIQHPDFIGRLSTRMQEKHCTIHKFFHTGMRKIQRRPRKNILGSSRKCQANIIRKSLCNKRRPHGPPFYISEITLVKTCKLRPNERHVF